MQVADKAAPAEQPIKQLSEEEKAAEWKKFESIIYSNLELILEKRPTLPVTKFAIA
jgi:hypothetical protein